MKKLIIVASMHRSGTSAFMGAIEKLGVQLGKNLAAGHKDINARGYKEDLEAIDLHENLLWSMQSAWNDITPLSVSSLDSAARSEAVNGFRGLLKGYFQENEVCGLKDPRVCLVLPLWLEACRQENISVTFIVPFRDPLAVARSLAKRDNHTTAHSLALWTKYMLAAEEFTRGHPRLFASYEKLIEQPSQSLENIYHHLGLSETSSLKQVLQAAVGFVSPELNRNSVCEKPVISQNIEASQLFALFQQSEGKDIPTACHADIDNIATSYKNYINSLDPVAMAQVEIYKKHAIAFRHYWLDAINSRSVRIGQLIKRMFPF